MMSTLGSLVGLAEIGLLDGVNMMTGLSGSTWAMLNYMHRHQRNVGHPPRDTDTAKSKTLLELESVLETVTKHIEQDFLKPHTNTFSDVAAFLARLGQIFKERLIESGHSVGLLDLMGALLLHHLLHDIETGDADYRNLLRLSAQSKNLSDGQLPFPIYTAVNPERSATTSTHIDYRWFEFTPFEVGTVSQDAVGFLPTYALGRYFDPIYNDGEIQWQSSEAIKSNELALGVLMATWGSAISASLQDTLRELNALPDLPNSVKIGLAAVEVAMKAMSAETSRLISPVKVPNFLFDPTSRLRFDHELAFVDAGHHFNLPFPPLLRSERQVDVILVLDQSDTLDIMQSKAMTDAKAFLEQQRKYDGTIKKFPASLDKYLATHTDTNDTPLSRQAVSVFPGDPSQSEVSLIYFPLIANSHVSGLDGSNEPFDPRSRSGANAFLSTQNFQYTREQSQKLAECTRRNVVDNVDVLKTALREMAEGKMPTMVAAPLTGR